MRHWRDLGHVDDSAGAVARVRTLVVDVHLVGVRRGDLVRIRATNENSAVGFGVDPEFRPDLEVGIGSLRDQEAIAFVGDDDTVGELPIGVADCIPIIEARPVEQRDPAGVCLSRRLLRLPQTREAHGNEPQGDDDPAFHRVFLPFID